MKLLAINGSPKNTGTTASLLQSFTNEAKRLGAKVETINLYEENIPLHTGELDKAKLRLDSLQQKITDCDGFVIASPTHWFNVSSAVKLFIDHLTDLEDNSRWLLEGKVAGFVMA